MLTSNNRGIVRKIETQNLYRIFFLRYMLYFARRDNAEISNLFRRLLFTIYLLIEAIEIK